MVDLLLSRHGLEIGDSLMYVIRENQYSIVVKLLDILPSENPENVKLGYDVGGPVWTCESHQSVAETWPYNFTAP
jgi:hypothetical protein